MEEQRPPGRSEAGTGESSDRGIAAEREWSTLRQLVHDIEGDIARSSDCRVAEATLVRLSSLRSSLDRLEHALQTAHFACCILPDIEVPAELALGLARLSAQRIGALVVIEQQRNLDEYSAGGTSLDAQVSASLLESLFFPGSALHDGAAIVRGARIIAAGVFVPLSAEHRDPVHGRLLGARHRAALGITSVTDALAFVVSEESGHIAVARHGFLHHAVPIDAMLGPDRGQPGAHATRGAIRAARSWWPRAGRWWPQR